MREAIRAIVVDDEPIARRTLRLLLAQDAGVELIADCGSVEAVALIRRARPDVLFLDVQMPELNGFELLEQVGIETVPAVVFVTAHDRHALKAFEVDAVDFLLKPFDDERFAAAMRRVRTALAGAAGPAYLRRFVVRTGERIAVVDAPSVDWIEAADYYASLHVGDRTYLVRQTMSELARALDPARFFRLQRSAIVNLDRVREIAPLARGEHAVVLADGTSLKLSRGRLRLLRERLAR